MSLAEMVTSVIAAEKPELLGGAYAASKEREPKRESAVLFST